MARRKPPFRDGTVHVMADRCSTCVFRPGNLMQLQPGRLRQMIRDGRAGDGGGIICHKTLAIWDPDGDGEAICRGFFDRFPTSPMQIAERLGYVTYQEEPDGM
jgi:hypothetical protein